MLSTQIQKTKVLIVGCGDVGTRLATRLIQNGHDVVGLRRSPPKDALRKISYFAADITSLESLSKLDTDFDQVFYAVAPDRRDERHYQDIYETGLSHLFNHFAKNNKKPHWIFVSSTAVYGVTNGAWIDESTPLCPTSFAGKFLLAAEKKILKQDAKNIIVRFSGIYGEGRERLIGIARNKTPVQADPPYYSNGIHQSDCVGVLAFLLEKRLNGVRLASCYLASDDEPAPILEVVSWLAKKLALGTAVKKPTNIKDLMNKRCDNGRLKTLGYQFKYPSYREGYLPLLAVCQKIKG